MRALAVALVVVHHTVTGSVSDQLRALGHPLAAAMLGHITNSGVELFFVLSGVVLLRPYLRRARAMDVASYFRRRIVRLWPPFLVAWLLAGLVVLLVSRMGTWYSPVLPEFHGIDWLRQIGIVNMGWPIYNLAWWSLTPELYFYLAVPLVIVAVRRWPPGNWPSILSWSATILLSVLLWHPIYSFPTIHAGWATVVQFLAYFPCFFAGVLLARSDYSARMGAGLSTLGVGWFAATQFVPQLNVHVAFALFYMGLLILTMGGGRLRRGFSHPVAVWLGERSYSLFVTHFSVLYLASLVGSLLFPNRTLGYFVFTRGVSVPAMLIVAMALFTLVERRFAHGLVTADAFWPWQSTDVRREPPPAAMTRLPVDVPA